MHIVNGCFLCGREHTPLIRKLLIGDGQIEVSACNACGIRESRKMLKPKYKWTQCSGELAVKRPVKRPVKRSVKCTLKSALIRAHMYRPLEILCSVAMLEIV